MNRAQLTITTLLLATTLNIGAQELIEGAQFIDRFLPLDEGTISADCWGAASVRPRNIDNGIEESTHSYWGGNILLGDDGKYHLFVASWPEDIKNRDGSKSGHELWWNSDVVHAISDSPSGPYTKLEIIGKGHNPEAYRKKDGSYVIGVMGAKAYAAPTINGPWQQIESTFDLLDGKRNTSNRTYTQMGDGRLLMMNKEGHIFISEDGEEHFRELDNLPTAYRRTNGSHEEDPVIWRDEVGYNLIVNNCLDCIAYHLTSPDGLRWSYEDGIAYTPNIVMNQSGKRELWHKLERPKVLLDEYGRVSHMNFAAADTLKHCDVAGDNHSSKNIVVPLRLARRTKLIEQQRTERSREVESYTVRIIAEEGFSPATDINIKTLRFGAAKLVNYGFGAKVIDHKADGKDLILTFDGAAAGLTPGDYKAKIIGREKNGEILFSEVRL